MDWKQYEPYTKQWLKEDFGLKGKIDGDTLIVQGEYSEFVEEFCEENGITYEESIGDMILIDLSEDDEFWEDFLS
jgi:translation initiation factor 1 (eIF-1/SUI1)